MQFLPFVYFTLILELRRVLSGQISGLRGQRHCLYVSISYIPASSTGILTALYPGIVLPHPKC